MSVAGPWSRSVAACSITLAAMAFLVAMPLSIYLKLAKMNTSHPTDNDVWLVVML